MITVGHIEATSNNALKNLFLPNYLTSSTNNGLLQFKGRKRIRITCMYVCHGVSSTIILVGFPWNSIIQFYSHFWFPIHVNLTIIPSL